jgi:phosphosulfolactate phosphohydrolase-like enzyme
MDKETSWFEQSGYAVRFDWAAAGAAVCGSGVEWRDKGHADDVEYAARLNVLAVAPRYQNGVFTA